MESDEYESTDTIYSSNANSSGPSAIIPIHNLQRQLSAKELKNLTSSQMKAYYLRRVQAIQQLLVNSKKVQRREQDETLQDENCKNVIRFFQVVALLFLIVFAMYGLSKFSMHYFRGRQLTI